MKSDFLVYGVGLTAQLLFAARLLVQWVKSERAGRVMSPTLFWQLSLVASILMVIYGVLRLDLVIILGQSISYFVYIRNLQYKNAWDYIPFYFKILVLLFPVLSVIYLGFSENYNLDQFLNNPEVPPVLLLLGIFGQAIFALRFLYQWFYSEAVKRSILPLGFWVISIIGSLIIMAYAIKRKDPVLFIGQFFGSAIYTRNILIHVKLSSINAVNSKG